MYCKICGCEENNVQFYLKRGAQHLCIECAQDTPIKVSKESFRKEFFGNEEVSPKIVSSFYDDYRTSNLTLKQYCEGCIL